MYTKDARKLDKNTQQQLRYYVIRLLENGKSRSEVIKLTGVSLSAIKIWWKAYIQSGLKGLVLKKRGMKFGTNRRLSEAQTEVLKNILVSKTPDLLGLNFSLWTRQAIQDLIRKLWLIQVPLRTITDYMKRLGFTPQKPIKRAYEQDPKAVNKWLNETYPKIEKKAQREGAEIHWLDETKLSSYSSYLRGFSPKGKTPIIHMKSKRMNFNIISSISKLGKMRFMIYKGSIEIKTLTEFTNRLRKSVPKKLFIIMDNLALHHSLKFKNWLEDHKNFVEVFYLPPYSPELNPDERLNRDLKTHFHSGPSVKNKKEFKDKIISFMMKVLKNPERIMNYFNSNHVRYVT